MESSQRRGNIKVGEIWEGKLIGRSEGTTTLKTMFEKHRELVRLAIAKRNTIRADYRAVFEDYNPKDWTDFADMPTQGQLL